MNFAMFVIAAAAVVEWWMHPIFVGLLVGLPTTGLGLAGLRRAKKLDKEASDAAIIATQGGMIQYVIDGLDKLVENLQEDNEDVRAQKAVLVKQLAKCHTEYANLKRLMDDE